MRKYLLITFLLFVCLTGCKRTMEAIVEFDEKHEIDNTERISKYLPDIKDRSKYKYVPDTSYSNLPFYRFPEYKFSKDNILGSYENEYYRIEIYDVDIAPYVADDYYAGIFMSIINLSNSIMLINISYPVKTGVILDMCVGPNDNKFIERAQSIFIKGAAGGASGQVSLRTSFTMDFDKIKYNKMKEIGIDGEINLDIGDNITGVIYINYENWYPCIWLRHDNYTHYNYAIKFEEIYIDGIKMPSEWFVIKIPEEKSKYWWFLQFCQSCGDGLPICGERGYNYTGEIK